MVTTATVQDSEIETLRPPQKEEKLIRYLCDPVYDAQQDVE